jgi:hypothetical protein
VIAVALVGVLGAVVAADAGRAVGLAVTLAALSELCLLIGLVAGWSSAVLAALALLATAFLLRHGDSLAVAPLFAGGLLLVSELAQQSVALRGVVGIERGVVTSRVAHVLGIAALGAAAGAAATIGVRFAPSHAVGVTAIGAAAVVAVVAAVSWLARYVAGAGR